MIIYLIDMDTGADNTKYSVNLNVVDQFINDRYEFLIDIHSNVYFRYISYSPVSPFGWEILE